MTAFVYYNTQVLNKYKTADQFEQLSADYEKKYKKYESAVLPKIHDVKYFIDLFPYKRDVIVKAKMTLVNESSSTIDSIHYNYDSRWEPEILIPNAELVLDDTEFEYRIYKLSKAMNPGDRIEIEINTKYISNGFENEMGNTGIINNGTFLNNFEILPALGYQSGNELSDKNTRKKYDLKAKDRMPKLEANCSDNCMKNYLTGGTSDSVSYTHLTLPTIYSV